MHTIYFNQNRMPCSARNYNNSKFCFRLLIVGFGQIILSIIIPDRICLYKKYFLLLYNIAYASKLLSEEDMLLCRSFYMDIY